MRIITLVFALLLIVPQYMGIQLRYPDAPPEVQTMLREFEDFMDVDLNGVQVKVIPMYELHPLFYFMNIIGYCHPDEKVAYLNVDFWNAASKVSKELLLYHELGHCYL